MILSAGRAAQSLFSRLILKLGRSLEQFEQLKERISENINCLPVFSHHPLCMKAASGLCLTWPAVSGPGSLHVQEHSGSTGMQRHSVLFILFSLSAIDDIREEFYSKA